MMLTRPAAQELLDGLSALSLGASAFVVARFGLASALRSRLGFVFVSLCLFFAVRAGTDGLGSQVLGIIDQMIACVLPLAALLLVEGALRRHAPKALKAFVVFGGLAIANVLLVPATHVMATRIVLGTYVIGTLVAVTVLLVVRDRSSLSRQENAGLDALAVPGVLLTLLSISDFTPSLPVGLSDVGCAMLAFVLAANPSSRREARGVLGQLLIIASVVVIGEPAFAYTFAMTAPPEQVRLGAILLALLLATAAVLRVRDAREGGTTQSFARALALADTRNVDAFLDSLDDQPLMAGLRLAGDAQLGEYDRDGLATALAVRAVWTRAVLRDATVPVATRPREELADLMTRTDATHAVMISRDPLRIALFTLPGGGVADFAETDLALFGKLAAVAATEYRAPEFR